MKTVWYKLWLTGMFLSTILSVFGILILLLANKSSFKDIVQVFLIFNFPLCFMIWVRWMFK